MVSNSFWIFTPILGDSWSNFTCTYFFNWVGSTTNYYCSPGFWLGVDFQAFRNSVQDQATKQDCNLTQVRSVEDLVFSGYSYCWWLKSCTTKDDDYPIIYRVLTIPGCAGFQPSTAITEYHWVWLIIFQNPPTLRLDRCEFGPPKGLLNASGGACGSFHTDPHVRYDWKTRVSILFPPTVMKVENANFWRQATHHLGP